MHYKKFPARSGRKTEGFDKSEVLSYLENRLEESNGRKIIYKHPVRNGVWYVSSQLDDGEAPNRLWSKPINPLIHYFVFFKRDGYWWSSHVLEEDFTEQNVFSCTKVALKLSRGYEVDDEWRKSCLEWHKERKVERFRWKKFKDNVKEGDPIYLREQFSPKKGKFVEFIRESSYSGRSRAPRTFWMEDEEGGMYQISMKYVDINKTVVRVLLNS